MSDIDPFENFTPRQNQPKENAAQSQAETRPNLTDDELRAMAREKLSQLLQSIDAAKQPSLLLSVAREVMDRIEGKPTQRIEQKVEHSSNLASSEMTNEQLIQQLRLAMDKGLLPPGTKLLEDGTVITDAEYVEVSNP